MEAEGPPSQRCRGYDFRPEAAGPTTVTFTVGSLTPGIELQAAGPSRHLHSRAAPCRLLQEESTRLSLPKLYSHPRPTLPSPCEREGLQGRGSQGTGSRSYPPTNQPCAGCWNLSEPRAPRQGDEVTAAPGTPPRTAVSR